MKPPDEKETRPGKPEAGRSGERSTSSASARPLQGEGIKLAGGPTK